MDRQARIIAQYRAREYGEELRVTSQSLVDTIAAINDHHGISLSEESVRAILISCMIQTSYKKNNNAPHLISAVVSEAHRVAWEGVNILTLVNKILAKNGESGVESAGGLTKELALIVLDDLTQMPTNSVEEL